MQRDAIIERLTQKLRDIERQLQALQRLDVSPPSTAIADGAVTLAKMADLAQATVIGRALAAGTGAPTALSVSQLNAIIDSASLWVHLTGTETVAGVKTWSNNAYFSSQMGIGTVAPSYLVESNRSGDDTNIVQMSGSAAGTGSTLRALRNRSSANTDSPVVNIIQDATTDDQAALRVQQDGSGDLLQLYDGTNLAVSVLDGGFTQLITTAAGVTFLVGCAVLENSSTTRRTRVGAQHFDTAEEPVGIFHTVSTSTYNVVIIGGGSSNFNAATYLDMYVAADGTTTTGTRKFRLTTSGTEFTNKISVAAGDPASIGASVLGIQAGASSNDAAVGGVLYAKATQTGNVGTGEDDLASYSVPANTLSTNGMSLWFEAFGTMAANGNTKTLRIRFGTSGTNLILNRTGGMQTWRVQGRIVRTGAATQKAIITVFTPSATETSITTSLDQTLSGTVIFKVTGEASNSNDIVIESFIVGWDDANV